jgi:uncharacterized protein YmfQ (DUF2313 family)
MDITAYKNLLNQLLPEGLAWNKSPDSNLQKLISGEAIEYARLEEEALRVLREINPLTTSDMLAEWAEIALGDHTCPGLINSSQELKKMVLARLLSLGGSDRIYFQEVAKAAGFLVKVSDGFVQFRAGRNRCQDRVLASGFAYTWNVRARTNTLNFFRTGISRANDRILNFSNSFLECIMNQVKPAHTQIIYSYEDVTQLIDGEIYVDVALAGAMSLIRFVAGQIDVSANLALNDTFSPSSLGGLFLWFDANTFTSAGTTSTWTDLKSNANAIQNESAKQPEKVLNAFNGKPVLRLAAGKSLSVKNILQMSANNNLHFFGVTNISSGGGKLFDRNQYSLTLDSSKINSVTLSDFYSGYEFSTSGPPLFTGEQIWGIAYFQNNFYLSATYGLWRLNNNGTWTDVAAGLTNRAPRGPLVVGGNKLFAVSSTVNQVLVWDGTTANEYTNSVNASASLTDLVYNAADSMLYIADGQNGKLIRFNPANNTFSQIGTGATNCNSVTSDGTNVYINKRSGTGGDIFRWNGTTFTSEALPAGINEPNALFWANGTLWTFDTTSSKLLNKATGYALASGAEFKLQGQSFQAKKMLLFENQLFIAPGSSSQIGGTIRYKLNGTELTANNWVKNYGSINQGLDIINGGAEIVVNNNIYYYGTKVNILKKERSATYSSSIANQNLVYLGLEKTRARLGYNGQIVSTLTYPTENYRDPNILLEQINITNGSLVTFLNDLITINPANNLPGNSKIKVTLDPTTVVGWTGINDWSFEVV